MTSPARPDRTPVRSYRTRFQLTEDPISEGGMWVNGKAEGIDWADVVTEQGRAHGGTVKVGARERRAEQGNLDGGEAAAPEGDYDDPTAVLTGSWGPNQYVKATVFSRNQTADLFQEVEIRLRSSIGPHWCSGYEVFWRCLKTDEGYAEIVRWNGPIMGFTSLARAQGPQFAVQDGDVVEATIVGNQITSSINGVEVLSATDDAFANGSPGIGFNFGCGDTYVDHGFTSYEVDTYDG
ncbi:MAG: hypothetical protein ACHQNA_08465 [Acidimicrobiales bacterium]